MNRIFKLITLTLLSVPLVAAAYGRGYGWHGGYGWRGPGWGFGYGVGLGLAVGAPYYYGYPGYYYPYGGPYYGYGNGYYPPPIYAPPVVVAQQPPAAYWYYCPPAKAYFPYVRECPTGWQAVPARGQPRAAQRAPMPAPAGRVTYSLGDVLFATGKSELRPAAVSTLDTLLASISKEPNRHLVVEGYTDSVGSADSNLGLSQRRADSVMQYLVAHGIAPQRISASGKGEADPVDSNATSKGRRHNRRVNVVVE